MAISMTKLKSTARVTVIVLDKNVLSSLMDSKSFVEILSCGTKACLFATNGETEPP